MRRQAIILGGGTSVLEGIRKGLFDRIENRFTVGLNYTHHFVRTTFLMYVDETFANGQKYYLERLPLVIGMEHAGVSVKPNTIELPATTDYHRDCSNGVYRASLAGLFALSFLIHVLDEGEIFLLGFDYGAKKGKGLQGRAYDKHGHPLTHWYQHGDVRSIYTGQKQEIRHRGIGKINWYEATHKDEKSQQRISRAEQEFQVYASERKVSIYNVSAESVIPTFPKVSYDRFFTMLDNEDYDQETLRTEVAQKAVALRKMSVR